MRAHRGAFGLVALVASSAAFSTSGALATGLIAAGWSAGAAVIARVGLAALVLTPPALVALSRRSRSGTRWSRRESVDTIAYGVVAVAVAQLCYFSAVPRLGVGVSLLLEYSGSVLVVLWTWLRHGHRPGGITLAGAALAVLGLVLVLDVAGRVHLDPVGVLYGLGAAVGLAVYYVLSASVPPAGPGREPVPPVVMAWGGTGVGALALVAATAAKFLPFRASTAPVPLHPGTVPWVVPVLGLALVAAAFAYVVGIVGVRLLGPRLSTFVGLTEVLFAILVAWALLGQLPTASQLGGGAVVVLGVALVRIGEERTREVTASDEDDSPKPVLERALAASGQ